MQKGVSYAFYQVRSLQQQYSFQTTEILTHRPVSRPDPTRSKLLTWRSGDRVPSLVSRSRDHQVVTAVIADFTYSHNYSRRSCILLVLHVEIYLLLIVHASVYLLLYSVITAYEGAF